jgi:hypothetical protein
MNSAIRRLKKECRELSQLVEKQERQITRMKVSTALEFSVIVVHHFTLSLACLIHSTSPKFSTRVLISMIEKKLH